MSGTTPCLLPNKNVVVDTHVFGDAVAQDRAGIEGKDRRLFHEIDRICSRIIWSPTQGKEILRRLREFRYRFPTHIPEFLKDLDRKGKLQRIDASKIQPLTVRQRKPFTRSLRDDIHLYEAARSGDRLVITEDEHQLKKRATLTRATEVMVVSVEEAMENSD